MLSNLGLLFSFPASSAPNWCSQSFCAEKGIFSFCDLKLWPVTLTYKPDLDTVKMNHYAEYSLQRSFRSKVVIRTHTCRQTHPTDYSIRPLKWLITIWLWKADDHANDSRRVPVERTRTDAHGGPCWRSIRRTLTEESAVNVSTPISAAVAVVAVSALVHVYVSVNQPHNQVISYLCAIYKRRYTPADNATKWYC